MKITICGSTAFIKEMEKLSEQLSRLGHEVKFPPVKIKLPSGEFVQTLDYYALKKSMPALDHWFWESHPQRIKDHFEKVEWAEAILIANYDKNDIIGYIGPNTLMEMGLAFHLGKKIFLFNPVPKVAYREEILGMRPITIDGRLDLIK